MKGIVRYDGEASDPFVIKSGVKQGCVLASTLFGIFFSLLLRFATSHPEDGVHLHTRTYLQDSKPRDWWREVKQLCGSVKTSGSDLTSVLHPVLVCDESTLANKINQAFISVMEDYSPLTDCVRVEMDDDEPISVTELSVARKLREISSARAGGPDDLPNWALREYADIVAAPIADILNTSFSECKVPRAWKLADVPPLPKAPTVSDINKDLRPISLTSTLSKVAGALSLIKH